MKCVAIKEAKKLEISEIDEPVSKDGYVVIEVKKAGIIKNKALDKLTDHKGVYAILKIRD